MSNSNHIALINSDPRYIATLEKPQRTKEICMAAFAKNPWILMFIPTRFITVEMADITLATYPNHIEYVPQEFYYESLLCFTHSKSSWDNPKVDTLLAKSLSEGQEKDVIACLREADEQAKQTAIHQKYALMCL